MKAPTAAQIRARKLFAERARSGTFKRRKNPMSAGPQYQAGDYLDSFTYSDNSPFVKANPSRNQRYTQAYPEYPAQPAHEEYGYKRNPAGDVAHTILAQLGGNRFIAMTGAKSFLGDPHSLMFTLPGRLTKGGTNKVRITLQPNDTYSLQFLKLGSASTGYKTTLVDFMQDVHAEQLRQAFTRATGLDTALGERVTFARSNPRSRSQDMAIAMSEKRAGHPRKATEFFERAARAKNPAYRGPAHFVEVQSHADTKLRTSTLALWHFSPTEHKGARHSFKLPAKVAHSADFQAWVRGLNGVISCTYQQLRQKVARFA
jgi:hypothetical protein